MPPRRSPFGPFLGPALVVAVIAFLSASCLGVGSSFPGQPHAPQSRAYAVPLTPLATPSVAFHETGLPTGVHWNVSTWPAGVEGPALLTSTSDTSTLSAAIDGSTGAIEFAAWTVPGAGGSTWVATTDPSSPILSSVTAVNVTFTQEAQHANYTLALTVATEGLPFGIDWTFTANATGYASDSPTQQISEPAYRAFNVNAPPLYLSNGTAFVPTQYDLLPATLSVGNSSWVNRTTGPFSMILRGPAFLLVRYSPEYRLTVEASLFGSASPPSEWVAPGVPVQLNATPAPGSSFLGWSGNGPGAVNSTNARINVTLSDGPIEELASFDQFRYTVIVNAFGLPAGQVFTVDYFGTPYSSYNGSLVLPASPPKLYSFSVPDTPSNVSSLIRYAATGASSTLPLNASGLNVTANGTVNVTFAPEYALEVTSTAGGTVTPGVGEYWESPSAPVALTASPSPGWHFGGWSGSGPGGLTTLNASLIVDLAGPVNESALFLPGPAEFTVVVSETGLPLGVNWSAAINGSGTSGSGSTLTILNVPLGTYLVVAPDVPAGYGVRYVVASPGNLAVAIIGNTSVSLTFEVQYYIQSSSTQGGSASPSPGWVPSGSPVHFSAAPNTGDQFVGWEGTVASSSPALNLSATGPMNETAVFEVPSLAPPVPFTWYEDAAGLAVAAVLSFALLTLLRRRSASPPAP